jgi:hypothetical protein
MEWSSAEPTQWFAPYVTVTLPDDASLPGGGRWSGPCAAGPSNCSAREGMRWEEAEPNAAGQPRVVKLIDDRPDLARRICVTVQHSFAADMPFGGRITGTLTLTGFDGVARSVPFEIDKGQSTAAECSPQEAPKPTGPTGGPFQLDPPAWWREGRKVLKQRGGACTTEHLTVQEASGATWTSDYRLCTATIPKAIGVAYGGNPAAQEFSESCDATATQNRPKTDEWYYNCTIYAFPGSSAKPNIETWRCFRQSFFSPGYGSYIDAWSTEARRGSLWPKRRTKNLRECLSPRAVARMAPRGAGASPLRVSAMCSHACTATVTALRNGKAVGTARRSLAAWRSATIRVPLTRRARGAADLTYRLTARAGRRRGTSKQANRDVGTGGRAADVFLRK